MTAPKVWDLPSEIRRRLTDRSVRQRTLVAGEHVLMALHEAPKARTSDRKVAYFWKNAQGEWFFSGRGAGLAPLRMMIDAYEAAVEELEAVRNADPDTRGLYRILEHATPLLRAARNLFDALERARVAITDPSQRQPLERPADRMSDVIRAAELLRDDARHALDYEIARESRVQSQVNREQARAAHRLNVLAAIFLPLGTIAAAFGMNISHGLETGPPWIFWLVTSAGAALGIGLSGYILGFKRQNVDRLIE